MEITLHTDHYFNSAADRIASQAAVGGGETATDRDTANAYMRTTTGWLPISVGGAPFAVDQGAKVSGLYNTDGTYPKTQVVTADPKHLNDVPNYTLHSTQGVVAEAEIQTITYTPGMNVTGFLVDAWGGAAFLGYYFTVNAASLADAAVRLRSNIANAATLRNRVGAGKTKFPKYAAEITRIDFVAIDNDATPDNNAEIEPY
jgi:hypothetical protein